MRVLRISLFLFLVFILLSSLSTADENVPAWVTKYKEYTGDSDETPATPTATPGGRVVIIDQPAATPSQSPSVEEEKKSGSSKNIEAAGKILCIVEDRSLSQAMVNKLLEPLMKNQKGDPEELERTRFVYTQNIMTEWLERNLLAVEAEREGITATDQEVEEHIQALIQMSDRKIDIEGLLDKMGLTLKELRSQMRDSIMGEKLVRRRIPAYYSESDLRKVYEANPGVFRRPPQVRASHVFCPLPPGLNEDEIEEREDFMDDVRGDLKDEEDPRKIASKADPEWNVVGGDLGWLSPLNNLPRPINSLVFKLKKGKVSKVEKTEYGFYVVRVEDKRPRAGDTFEEVRDQVIEEVFFEVRPKVIEIARKSHKVYVNMSGIPPDKIN